MMRTYARDRQRARLGGKMVARPRLAFIGMLVLAMLAGSATSADANHAWKKYHWARTSNPFTIQLGNNVSGSWGSYLNTASADWTASTVLNAPVVPGNTTGATCAPTRGMAEVCSANYGNTGWLGVAQIWITTGSHIAQGTVKNNDYYFGSSTYAYNNSAEQLHVICQEIGHIFGLDHQSETGASLNTCMDYYHNTSATDTLSTHPNQHDYDQLVKIYSHTDRFDSTAASSGGAAAVFANGHAPDGTPNGASKARGHWYVELLAGGELLFTHVYWAD